MPMPYLLLQTVIVPAIALKGACLTSAIPFRGKAILSSTAGILVYMTGIRDMNKMGGLASKMPITALLWVCGALILSALPPLSGFAAEWVLFTGVFTFGVGAIPVGLIIAILSISAVLLTIVYTFAAAKKIFFGPLKPELANDAKIKDPPLTMSVPLLSWRSSRSSWGCILAPS